MRTMMTLQSEFDTDLRLLQPSCRTAAGTAAADLAAAQLTPAHCAIRHTQLTQSAAIVASKLAVWSQ